MNSEVELQRIEGAEYERLSRFVYCHHCHTAANQKVLGRNRYGETVFQCVHPDCGRKIPIKVIPPRSD